LESEPFDGAQELGHLSQRSDRVVDDLKLLEEAQFRGA
jgi:hypothetical protein